MPITTGGRLITAPIRARLLDIARSRNSGKSPSQSRKVSQYWTDEHVDLVGVIGEFIVAEATGASIDDASYGAGGDNGVDMCIHGIPVAVKTNHRPGGWLLLERWRDVARVKALVLVTGSCRPYLTHCDCRDGIETQWRVAGCVSVQRFKAKSERANWGYGPRRYMQPSALVDISQIQSEVLRVVT